MRILNYIVLLALMIGVGCGKKEPELRSEKVVTPGEAANKLFVESTLQMAEAVSKDDKGDIDGAVADYGKVLVKVRKIVSDYPESDIAVKLVSGEALFTGKSLEEIEERVEELKGDLARRAEEKRTATEQKQKSTLRANTVKFFCFSNMKKPTEEIIMDYEKEHPGRRVEVTYGDSATLLAEIKARSDCDLYLAADASFIAMAQATKSSQVAKCRAIIIVKKGNPKKITTVDDLMRKDVRVVLGAELSLVGNITKALMEQLGRWKDLKQAIEARGSFMDNINGIASSVELGVFDAGIIWDYANLNPGLESIMLEGKMAEMEAPIPPIRVAADATQELSEEAVVIDASTGEHPQVSMHRQDVIVIPEG